MTGVEVTIVILCLGDAFVRDESRAGRLDIFGITRNCINLIEKHTPPIYKLLVIADACSDEMLAWLRKKARVIANTTPVGFSKAFNIAMNQIDTKYMAMVDIDISATEHWLEPLIQALEEHPEWGWVASRVMRGDFPMNFGSMSSTVFLKEALDRVGPYDERYAEGTMWLDNDLLLRFWLAGYEPHGILGSTVLHPPTSLTAKMLGEEFDKKCQKNQQLLIKKWGPGVMDIDWANIPLAGVEGTSKEGIAVILAAGATSEYGNVDFYKGAQSAFLMESAERVEKEMKQIEPPKCLFKCRGEVLLERQVRLLRECGIGHIKIITNFKEDMIREFDKKKKLGLEFIHNPDFRKPFVGLRSAMEKEGDCLLILGDVYLTKNIIERLVNERKFVGATVEENHPWLLCKIPDTTEFLVRYAEALTYWLCNLQNTGTLEILYNRVSRLFDSELLAFYTVCTKYGASTIVDQGLLDLDIYEFTDDYTERWGQVDQLTEGRVTSFKVKEGENHSPIIKGLEP